MKVLYITLGFICVGLGIIGIILPILPSTPFLLAASFFFTKGSTKFQTWFVNTNLYQRHLASFVATRSMTRRTKISLLSFASFTPMIAFLVVDIIYARVTILFVIIFKYYYFITKIKTERE